ncbi:DASH family cryptochrome [Marinirhabdus gelatinilytica]|uniref:Cryptochrome DASH n=1 Tax=Marinirhabdus gelatinilytica TaxID=1703343 RepID=A0A370Q8H8_9FLAO|nr:DASH family cryptochrome [Marinirhabdus gelatinilytica]RDK84666.1 deoxyribodipyrimidine photo-lyase (single-stranded DNA-specific) [Marinirhabdus gelatinilytica]
MTQLVWFRNNLRSIDNKALTEACKRKGAVAGIYCFDPRHYGETLYGFPKTGAFRAKFLLETILDLQETLKKVNIPLYISTKKPEESLPDLVKKIHVSEIFTQKEWTSEEATVTTNVKKALPEDIQLKEYYDQFLFHPEDIPFEHWNNIPRVFTDFRKKFEKYGSVQNIINSSLPLEQDNRGFPKNVNYSQTVPALQDLGLQEPKLDSRTAFSFKGGETEGKKRMEDYIWNTQNIATYKQTRNGLIGKDYSSKFSAWLANGSLSPRMVYWEVKNFETEVKKNQDTYWMIFELIWRDFFKYISLKHGDKLFNIGGILGKNYDWGTSEVKKQQWIKGNTKYDFVNANMKEIAATGWMSNRGRQNVGSFWAKELQQDWRVGASYFESQLIDYDVHSNWGNWQYVSGVGNDPRDRKFNIEKQSERYDPDDAFIKLWLQ